MNNGDKQEFIELMVGIADNFSATIGDVGLRLRFEALNVFSIEQLKDAAIIILRTRKYTTMPTVADFFEAIEGNPDEIADIQKSIVMEAYNRYQPNQKFDDPVTQGVINKIGWGKIGQVNVKEIPFLLKDFKDMYKSYKKVESGHVLNAPAKLKGLLTNLTKRIE